ncbi:hypothetical protein SO802_032163 [Lithocarpus litseifolius]|uniref:Uncharacterized protein n=1 Tax=Lithocarpus litseifolius TaxID=425828 RepID=A0AAW2BPX0_9ROSI
MCCSGARGLWGVCWCCGSHGWLDSICHLRQISELEIMEAKLVEVKNRVILEFCLRTPGWGGARRQNSLISNFGRRRVAGWVRGEGSLAGWKAKGHRKRRDLKRRRKRRRKRCELKRRQMVRRMKHRELKRRQQRTEASRSASKSSRTESKSSRSAFESSRFCVGFARI